MAAMSNFFFFSFAPVLEVLMLQKWKKEIRVLNDFRGFTLVPLLGLAAAQVFRHFRMVNCQFPHTLPIFGAFSESASKCRMRDFWCVQKKR